MNNDDLPLIHSSGGFTVAAAIGVFATGLFYWLMQRAGAKLRP